MSEIFVSNSLDFVSFPLVKRLHILLLYDNKNVRVRVRLSLSLSLSLAFPLCGTIKVSVV